MTLIKKRKYKGIVSYGNGYAYEKLENGKRVLKWKSTKFSMYEAEQAAMHKAARKNPPYIFAKRNPKGK